jgi:ribosomal protein L22
MERVVRVLFFIRTMFFDVKESELKKKINRQKLRVFFKYKNNIMRAIITDLQQYAENDFFERLRSNNRALSFHGIQIGQRVLVGTHENKII